MENNTPLTEEEIQNRRNALVTFIELAAAELHSKNGLSILRIIVEDGKCVVSLGSNELDDQN